LNIRPVELDGGGNGACVGLMDECSDGILIIANLSSLYITLSLPSVKEARISDSNGLQERGRSSQRLRMKRQGNMYHDVFCPAPRSKTLGSRHRHRNGVHGR